MLAHLRQWFRTLFHLGGRKLLVPRCRDSRQTTRTLEILQLEVRVVPSVAPTTGGPPGLTPPIFDAYVFSNGSSSTAGETTTSPARWAQPGGLGAPIVLTYSFASSVTGGLNGVTYAQIRAATQEAMAEWSKYAPIQFVEVADAGPIFTTGINYDSTGDPTIRIGATHIDGALGVLGYGYYPSSGLGGDVVLDNSETWGVKPDSSHIDVTEVVEHELGHALGLAHELTNPAIMNPYYGARFSGPGTAFLYQDDVNGIRALYGAGSGSVTPLGSVTPTSPVSPVTPPANLPTFALSNGILTVTGTGGNDSFVFMASATQDVIVANGVQRTYAPASLAKIVFNGGAGTDSLSVYGTSAAETVSLDTTRLTMTGPGLNFQATGFETIAVTGNGGADSATLANALGKNTVALSSTQTSLTGNGLSWLLNGFSNVTVSAQHGGGDSATFSGTSGNDTFTGRPGTATLQGSNYKLTANGFDTVQAHNPGGGNDVAYLYDSAGNDTLLSANGLTTLRTSNGYTLQTSLFGPTYAFASGGYDRADLDGTAGTDTFTASPTFAGLNTVFGTVYAVGFDFVAAHGQGGYDIANLTGSVGNDSIYDASGLTSMVAGGVVIQVDGFKTTSINGGGGSDIIDVYDSVLANVFTQSGATSTLNRGDGTTTNVTNVANGTVHGGQGIDTAYLNDMAGNNTFFVQAGGGTLIDARGNWKLTGYQVISLLGTSGTDLVTVLDQTTTALHRSGHWA